ncbi:MAG: DUF3048 domain-containing protein [Clostridia bacterium]|nr:DUF3048 domain-containing protein [Clostridia bacterium]
MFKKIIALILCFAMAIAICGCDLFAENGNGDTNNTAAEDDNLPPEPQLFYNPLTGIKNLSKEEAAVRPVAVMINNITVAQTVQTGLNNADIIYETEVEGGITRLMAVYKNFEKVGQIGTIRSARYPYVDLALAHNAMYVHCGQDPVYCAPHLKDIDDISVDTGTTGTKRIKNGLATEHTLYIFGNELWQKLASKFSTESNNGLWQSFANEDETVTLDGGAADRVEIPFPILKTVFEYDKETGRYTRYSRGNKMTDYVTGEAVTVKNVFILLTTIVDYPDGKHRKVSLTGGEGYYITNGTYTAVKWEKGGEKSPIKITDTNGKAITVSAGNSWVCLPNASTCKPVFEAAVPTQTTETAAETAKK